MALIIQKFGGTSVSNISRIRKVAQIIKQEVDNNNEVIVVVSAMSGTTNDLVLLAKQLGAFEGNEEYDVVVSAGEQITAGLVSQALKELSFKSRSFSAWQLPIVTDSFFGKANIKSINTYILKEYVKYGGIPVITGFQGVCDNAKTTTFGRGGSDLTAVAIAAATNAKRCDIYTDVDGIFTADPTLVTTAKKLDQIDYNDMLEMSYSGAKVLQPRAVEYAIKHQVPVRVISSFFNGTGTIIGNFENKKIVGIALTDNLEKINIFFHSDQDFERLIEFLNDNLIRFNVFEKTENYVTIFFNKDEIHGITENLQRRSIVERIEYVSKTVDKSPALAKISVIGSGTHQVANRMLEDLEKSHIPITSVSPYNAKIIFWLEEKYSKKALKLLHDRFVIGQE